MNVVVNAKNLKIGYSPNTVLAQIDELNIMDKDPIINKSPRKDVSLRLSFVINEPNNIELKAIDRSSLETINPT